MRPVWKDETLSAERHTDGLWHARYPTATFTLCMRAVETQAKGRRRPPTCGECDRVARVFEGIDGSTPAHWLMGSVAA